MRSGDPPALLVDLYELSMAQAYFDEQLFGRATFELSIRSLPPERNYLVTAGLDDALAWLDGMRFEADDLDYLRTLERFTDGFLEYLGNLRFDGEAHAIPEGEIVFAGEPLLRVTGPLPAAQLAETYLINQVHFQTMAASKAARVVQSARGRPVIDFGLRRAHGTDAGLKASRSQYLAGVAATSNVLGGRTYGIPVAGTMAHSYVSAHATEMEAFRAFTRSYPETVLLIDTYDPREGARNVVRLARELGDDFAVAGVRIDSADRATNVEAVRDILDEGELRTVQIFVSGGLDEHAIERLLDEGVKCDGFGVGTKMGTSADAPSLDAIYKLVEYEGRGMAKLFDGMATIPGPKQVFRRSRGGSYESDVVGRADEEMEGHRLLVPVMREGQRLAGEFADLEAARERCRTALGRLPERLQALNPARPAYEVIISPGLQADADRFRRNQVA